MDLDRLEFPAPAAIAGVVARLRADVAGVAAPYSHSARVTGIVANHSAEALRSAKAQGAGEALQLARA